MTKQFQYNINIYFYINFFFNSLIIHSTDHLYIHPLRFKQINQIFLYFYFLFTILYTLHQIHPTTIHYITIFIYHIRYLTLLCCIQFSFLLRRRFTDFYYFCFQRFLLQDLLYLGFQNLGEAGRVELVGQLQQFLLGAEEFRLQLFLFFYYRAVYDPSELRVHSFYV